MKESKYIFFLLMALASGLSIFKTGVLAAILPTKDFALYAGVFASVAFVAEGVSFGLTQGTFKKYPRYTAYGRYGDLLKDVSATTRHLILRHLVFGILSVTFAYYFYGSQGAIVAASVSFLAIGMNAFSLVSSLFRALGRLFDLGLTTALRTSVALICGVGFALLGGWTGSFLSEALSSMLIGVGLIVFLRGYVRARFMKYGNRQNQNDTQVSNRTDGIILFVSFFVLTLPISLDRLFIARFGDSNAAATYAFVGIWLTAAYTVSGIYVQKYGPEVVTRLALDRNAQPLTDVRKNALTLASLLGLGTAVSMSALYFFGYEAFWRKYGLSSGVVAISILAVGLQVTALFDWALLALDGEKFLLIGAIILAVTTIGLFVLAFWSKAKFDGYALSVVIGRVCQIIWADRAIASLQRARTLHSRGAST